MDGPSSSRAAQRWAVRQAAPDRRYRRCHHRLGDAETPRNYGWAPIYEEAAAESAAGASRRIDAVISEEVSPADRRGQDPGRARASGAGPVDAADGAARWSSATAAATASAVPCSAPWAGTACYQRGGPADRALRLAHARS